MRPLRIVAAFVTVFMAVAPADTREQQTAAPLWSDITVATIGDTKYWTNKVEIADLNGDGRPDLLFANGGDYSTPGAPEPNQIFLKTGPDFRFVEATAQLFGPTPDLARVIKARKNDHVRGRSRLDGVTLRYHSGFCV